MDDVVKSGVENIAAEGVGLFLENGSLKYALDKDIDDVCTSMYETFAGEVEDGFLKAMAANADIVGRNSQN